ncbi:VanZ family protein [Paenibacillus xanthanilyticus]|uniref:VanZ family protein n=1 Tax=Paenibacillus xanthanilyticus TaxID=1783531 RepID=A0ABV8K9B6_9BACL
MSIQEIFGKVMVYLAPAAAAILALLSAAGLYLLLQRKKHGAGTWQMSRLHKPFIGVLLLGYLLVVFGLTGLSRTANYAGATNFHLFSGYMEAWNNYSIFSFQLIVFNILMFVPLGILLPLLTGKLSRFRGLFAASLGTTLLIETIQLVTARGIFELDDLFHNTLGSVIGYHLYMLGTRIYQERRLRLAELTKRLAIPVAIGVLFFGTHLVYVGKDFGNMRIHPVYGTDMSGVTITTSIPFSHTASTSSVYKNEHSLNRKRGQAIAHQLQDKLGLPPIEWEGRDGANLQFHFKESDGTRYIFTYFVLDGSWDLFDDHYHPEEHPAAVAAHEARAQAEAIMKSLALLPTAARMTVTENGEYDWRLPEQAYSPRDRWDGYARLSLKTDGGISAIQYGFMSNRYVRDVPIMSPTEALDQIHKGRFDQVYAFRQGDQLDITSYELSYVYDTKGYYQPVYAFEGVVNGENLWLLQIDARR